jgi:rubrerythrin
MNELDKMRAMFASAAPEPPMEPADWNSQFEVVKPEEDTDFLKAKLKVVEGKLDKIKNPRDAEKVKQILESFSLFEGGEDCSEEDSEDDRDRREHEQKINRVMDSWFQAKQAALSAKYEELKLKYPDNPERVKNAFEKWLRLTEEAMSAQDKDAEVKDDPDDDDDKNEKPATEKDVDDEGKEEDPPDADPEDDSVLNGVDDEGSEGGESIGDFSEEEVAIIDGLIESEVDAVSDYGKALNETQNETARKVYTELLNDETKHLQQLKYLKAKGTGGEYEPKDDEAKQELDGILESVIEEL